MTDPHVHTWLLTADPEPLGRELLRRELACACGATRVQVGYTWNNRRAVVSRSRPDTE